MIKGRSVIPTCAGRPPLDAHLRWTLAHLPAVKTLAAGSPSPIPEHLLLPNPLVLCSSPITGSRAARTIAMRPKLYLDPLPPALSSGDAGGLGGQRRDNWRGDPGGAVAGAGSPAARWLAQGSPAVQAGGGWGRQRCGSAVAGAGSPAVRWLAQGRPAAAWDASDVGRRRLAQGWPARHSLLGRASIAAIARSSSGRHSQWCHVPSGRSGPGVGRVASLRQHQAGDGVAALPAGGTSKLQWQAS
jgi:hypothetical protein